MRSEARPPVFRWLMSRLCPVLVAALALAGFGGVAGAAVVHPDLSYDLDSPVADPNLNALDIYTPDGAATTESRPVVVYVHGGGWRNGDKGNKIARKRDLFTGAGYVFASLNYRLSPDDISAQAPDRVKFPDHPHDVGEALGWLSQHVAEYGGDPTRMLLIGHSAGAHIVSLVSTDPRYVEAYGVEPWQLIGTVSLDTEAFDIADRIAEGTPARRDLFYSAFATLAENAVSSSWVLGSPVVWADPADTRFLFVVQAGIADRIADNEAMASALGQDPAGVFAAPYDHEGINDAVGAPDDSAGETAAIIDFFGRMVTASATPKAKLAKHPASRVETSERRARARFKLASGDPGVSFECRLDSRKLKHCGARPSYRVGHGRHTFRYRALAASGRPGKTKAFRFRVLVAG